MFLNSLKRTKWFQHSHCDEQERGHFLWNVYLYKEVGGVGWPKPCSELCLWYGEAISDLFYKQITGKEVLNSRGREISVGLTTRTIIFLSVWTTVNLFQINNHNRAFELLSEHLIWSNLWMWRWKVNPQGHLLSFTFSVWMHCFFVLPAHFWHASCCLITLMLVYIWLCAGDAAFLSSSCLFRDACKFPSVFPLLSWQLLSVWFMNCKHSWGWCEVSTPLNSSE